MVEAGQRHDNQLRCRFGFIRQPPFHTRFTGCTHPPLNSSFHLSGAVGRYATVQPNLWEGCILNSFLKEVGRRSLQRKAWKA